VKRAREVLGWLPPYQVVLAAFGIAVGLVPGLPHVTVSADVILAVFVPALIFEAALNLNLQALRAVALPVALLATVGVFMSIGLVGALCHVVIGLDWPSAILLGAILSPSDPIAVVAVVRRSGAPARLAALLEGESLFNDATGVTAFTAVLAAVAAGGAFSPAQAGSTFLLLSLGGIAVGAAIGLPAAALVRSTRVAPLEVAVTLVTAYGSYLLAARLGVSGVVAAATAGLTMARVATWGPDTERSWARIAIILNAILFTLIGVALPAAGVLSLAGSVATVFGILLVARVLPVNLLALGQPRRWRLLVWWGGVRGALSVALALAATGGRHVDGAVPVMAYGVVALSLLVQGSIVRPAISSLRLGSHEAGSKAAD
jgi:CPA1 family monovalent cation:H+ antiporter